MTETDTESIWATGDLDATWFGKVNIRIGELLNFEIMEDATSEITSVKVLPLLEHISEEILIELIAATKGSQAVVPWQFLQSNITKIFNSMIDGYWRTLKKIRKVLGQTKIEMVTRRLPRTTNSNVIP